MCVFFLQIQHLLPFSTSWEFPIWISLKLKHQIHFRSKSGNVIKATQNSKFKKNENVEVCIFLFYFFVFFAISAVWNNRNEDTDSKKKKKVLHRDTIKRVQLDFLKGLVHLYRKNVKVDPTLDTLHTSGVPIVTTARVAKPHSCFSGPGIWNPLFSLCSLQCSWHRPDLFTINITTTEGEYALIIFHALYPETLR